MASALLEALRRRATISGLRRNNVEFVWIRGPRANKTILKDDWALIEPFLQDGSFTELVAPTGTGSVRWSWLRREVAFNSPPSDGADKDLYARILNRLTPLFTEEWPTSTL